MTTSDSRIAVYTGSFDPITLGHLNVIERCSKLVDKLIVGIGVNIDKQVLFSPEERMEMVREATARLGNVEIRAFAGLAVTFVRECGARVMIRGVRSLSDMEAEFTMTLANRQLDPGIETVFHGRRGILPHLQLADQTDRIAGRGQGTAEVCPPGGGQGDPQEDSGMTRSRRKASCRNFRRQNEPARLRSRQETAAPLGTV